MRSLGPIVVALLVLLGALTVAAQADVATGNALVASSAERAGAPYRLCASDVIALTFALTPEFNQTVTVQPDGSASLVGVGAVHLQGLTTEESVAEIRAAYAKVLRDPVITIELKDFNKPYFIVSGSVNHPGKYDLRGNTRSTQALAIAGGLTETAKHSSVLLFRQINNDWYEVKLLNMKKILRGNNLNEDAILKNGDMLYVPQNTLSKVKRFIPSSGIGAYYQP